MVRASWWSTVGSLGIVLLAPIAVFGGTSASAQDQSSFKGKWIKTTAPSRPDQPGIGSWITFDAQDSSRLYLSWAAPVVVGDARGQHGANYVWRSNFMTCWYEIARAGNKLTLRLSKGEPPNICLEDSVFEAVAAPQPTTPPPQIEKSEPSRPPPAKRENPRDQVVRFIELITDYWNRGVLEPSVFAETLDYYGKVVPRSHAVAETAKYFQRWHTRRFEIDRGSISVTEIGAGVYAVNYRYTFSGARSGGTTRGSGTYSAVFRKAGSSFEITQIRDDYRPANN